MHRIDAADHVANQFSDGDQVLGVPGTKVDAAFMNAVQGELCNLLEGLGVTLVKGTHDQIETELKQRIARCWSTVLITTGSITPAGTSSKGCTPSRENNYDIRYTFTEALTTDDYVVVAFVTNYTTALLLPICDKSARQTTYFTLSFVDKDGVTTAINAASFAVDVVVFSL